MVMTSHTRIAAGGVLSFPQTGGKCLRFCGILMKGTLVFKVGSTTIGTLVCTELVPIDQEFVFSLNDGAVTLNNTGSDEILIYNLRVDQ